MPNLFCAQVRLHNKFVRKTRNEYQIIFVGFNSLKYKFQFSINWLTVLLQFFFFIPFAGVSSLAPFCAQKKKKKKHKNKLKKKKL